MTLMTATLPAVADSGSQIDPSLGWVILLLAVASLVRHIWRCVGRRLDAQIEDVVGAPIGWDARAAMVGLRPLDRDEPYDQVLDDPDFRAWSRELAS